jgi:hypothetical protein
VSIFFRTHLSLIPNLELKVLNEGKLQQKIQPRRKIVKYIHCFQLDGPVSSRLFIGPFPTDAAAEAFRDRIDRTRAASPELAARGYAMEIAPGIQDGWGAIKPEDFHGFSWFDLHTQQQTEIPLLA